MKASSAPLKAASKMDQHADRRTLRSRHALIEALGKLLKKRDFDSISVQEIVDEANLTRATFYLHYPDKTALLEALTSASYEKLLQKREITSSKCVGGLKAIALSVCEYLAKAAISPNGLSQMPLERSIIPGIEAIFVKSVDELELAPGVDPETFAAAIAWAIYGAASRWAQIPNRKSAEQMAESIASLVRPLLENVRSAR